MQNQKHNLKTHNMSKLLVIGLSIILITGICLVPALQIGVQGQVQQQQQSPPPASSAPPSPESPGGSPSSGASPPPPASSAAPSPESPGGSPSSGASPPPPASSAAPESPGGSPSSGASPPPPSPTTPSALDTADGGAANQTSEGGGGAVNQSAMVMIPQSTMEMILSQLQDAMSAIDSDNKDNATKAMNSVDQELKSAANASGISIETTTG
jgi:cytoskeletal protein RodZ